jgi:dTDP-4-amino-4,6-dideoxygalactose transaminase
VLRFLTPELPPVAAIEQYFESARADRWFSNGGPCHRLLVERLVAHAGGDVEVVPVANCTLGLVLAMRALLDARRPSGRKALLPSFTFPATASTVVWCGLEPVFVDVDPECWHLDPAAVADALERHHGEVAVVVACSTFGVPPPPDVTAAWESASREASVPLLVDSAAGFGARDARGRPLGAQGDVEAFSFHATKPMAIGEGGIVTTRAPDLARAIRELTNFGFAPDRAVHGTPGLNAKLDEWHAATALAALDRLDDVLAARRAIAESLLPELSALGLSLQRGSELGTWQFVPARAGSAEARSAVVAAGAASGVEVRCYFSPPLHLMPAFAHCVRAGDLSVTEDLSTRMLSLPMANDLNSHDVARVLAVVRSGLRRASATEHA